MSVFVAISPIKTCPQSAHFDLDIVGTLAKISFVYEFAVGKHSGNTCYIARFTVQLGSAIHNVTSAMPANDCVIVSSTGRMTSSHANHIAFVLRMTTRRSTIVNYRSNFADSMSDGCVGR